MRPAPVLLALALCSCSPAIRDAAPFAPAPARAPAASPAEASISSPAEAPSAPEEAPGDAPGEAAKAGPAGDALEVPAEASKIDTPFTLEGEMRRAIEVYPPLSTGGRRPAVVFLHATCMQPRPVCDAFGQAGRSAGWLVCPAGNSTCYGEPDWSGAGPAKAAFLERALGRVEERVKDAMAERSGVLVGWSRGAYAARDILMASTSGKTGAPLAGRFSGLVLIAASVPVDPGLMKAAGIRRVVLAAGDFDGARPAMQSTSASLKAAGVEARYVSLGKIAHWWPSDFEDRMGEPIRWAAEAP